MKKFFLHSLLISMLLSTTALTFAQNKIELEDIWENYTFSPNFISDIRSMNNGEQYCVLKNNEIVLCDYKTGKEVTKLLKLTQLNKAAGIGKIQINDYSFSPDESKILIATKTERIYRHSTRAEFYIWDIKNEKLSNLSENGKQRLAEYSPDGTKIAFVRKNNLFVKDIVKNIEIQITKDGSDGKIINGTTDWVYEEEFSFTKGFYWSPDSRNIAFYKFDETNVKEYSMEIYGKLYPEKYNYKYPKAGEDNSIVSINVYDVINSSIKSVDIGDEKDIYIPRIKWTNDPNLLSIQRMNRLQNKLEILIANINNDKTEVVYTEENKYYIDITDNLTFLDDNEHFVINSEADAYNHIYLYNFKLKKLTQLTKGEWDVIEIKGVDKKKKLVYYISAEDSPLERYLYSVKLDGSKKTKISQRKGWNEVAFSENYKYYINTFSDANTPPYYSINTSNGDMKIELENNSALIKKMQLYGFSKQEFFTIKTSEDIELNAWMIKPKDFDPKRKYPVFMYVYGGPGSQTVENSWGWSNYIWFQMLAQKGYIVVSVDNRGTGARGEEFKKCTYEKLGDLETKDQIEAAKWLKYQPYVDSDRIGIFGWSYGGYMSTLCITKGASYFKMAIAVAPVTNWRYYDNIYTERFMRTPQENGTSYDSNSPISHVEKLKGSYLLVHGTADDNVHIQNSYDLISALVKENKAFEMQFYTNKNHGIYGGKTRLHLYNRMTEFIFDNL
ncbi:MAG: S9 family peptidase [Saprospiraceae bacterium]|nr:S9 family peptidase [Saprospiraceae bacterium]